MDRNRLLDQLAAEKGKKPVEMVKPDKRGILDIVLARKAAQQADQPEEMQYPEPYKVDQDLREQGFQVPAKKRLLFERIARMLGKVNV